MTDSATPQDLPARVDVVVVGAGLMGAASTWQLAQRDIETLVLEQFEPATARGSSHGSARIVRRAYPHDDYVRLTGEAFDLWSELEAQSSRTLLRVTGGIDHGSDRNPRALAEAMTRTGIPHAMLASAEAEQRWPGLRFDGPVLFHEQAGTMDAALAVAAFLEVAVSRGVRVRTGVGVTGIEPLGDEALVHTDHGSVRARRVVVAAGAWCEGLIGSLVTLPPLSVTEHRVFHFPRRDESVTWPVTIHREDLDIYHLPGGRDGGPGDARKIAEHVGRPSDPRHRDPEVDVRSRERIVSYVQRWLPGLVPTPFGETTCLYTRTESEDFVIDRVGPIVVASACSGHGAKLSPVVGRLVADLTTDRDAAPFYRFSLANHRAP
ncbi:MAG: FAD-dependent oxidoreductase [Humibacillus sp.]|nr:FAD-dependent oxidoreductase [Humibacillus sp.]MDN5779474.1 FAD-dependent oxidoreductase [Humibacillus sp.]